MKQASPLQGEQLQMFLHRVQSVLPEATVIGGRDDEATENHLADIDLQNRRAAARELLSAQAIIAGRDTLCRLHELWRKAAGEEQARAVWEKHKSAIMQTSSGDERLKTQIELSLYELSAVQKLEGDDAIKKLEQIAQWICQLPVEKACYTDDYNYNIHHYGYYYHDGTPVSYWEMWKKSACQHQAWDLAEQGIDWQYQQEKVGVSAGREGLDAHRPYLDKAMFLRRKPATTEAEKQQLQQRISQHVQGIIHCLNKLDGKHPEAARIWKDTLEYIYENEVRGSPLLVFIPELLQAQDAWYEHENVPQSPLQKAIRQVRKAKYLVATYYYLERWQEALAHVDNAWFNIEDDAASYDECCDFCLSVMERNGALDQAASMALECFLHTRGGSAAALLLAQHCLDIEEPWQSARTRAIWHLIVVWAVIDPEVKDLLEHAEIPRPKIKPDVYFKKARHIADGDDFIEALIDYIKGFRKARFNQWEEALPLLERAVSALPQLGMSNTVVKLWCARFAVLEPEQALARPWYLPEGGTWCYYTARKLQDPEFLFENQAVSRKHRHILPPEHAREALALYYYEEALRRFDAFCESGKGVFTDCTTTEGYSDLCTELCAIYRRQQRYAEGAALSQKYIAMQHDHSMAGWQFLGHYANLLFCQLKQEADSDLIVSTAESLWQIIVEWLEDGYQPDETLVILAHALPLLGQRLHRSGRTLDLIVWLERVQLLLEGQLHNDNTERQAQTESSQSAFRLAQLHLIALLQETHPELVQSQWSIQQQAVAMLADSDPLKNQCLALLATRRPV